MTTKQYPNISPAAAKKFLAAALAAGFVTNPETVDVSYGEPFTIDKELPLGFRLSFWISYNPETQECMIALVGKPSFLTDAFIFAKIDYYVAMASHEGVAMPDMSTWANYKPAKFRPYFKLGPEIHALAEHADEMDLWPPHPKPLTIQQNAVAYNFPKPLPGPTVTVGVIELGGGYTDQDLEQAYPGLSKRVAAKSVSDGQNSPGEEADGEVLLDTQIIGILNPFVQQNVYFAPNSDTGFVDAIKTAIDDSVCCISISWGGPEKNFPAIAAMEAQFARAKTLKIPVFSASGDNLATDNGELGLNVDYPASSPNVIGCGGTLLVIDSHGAIHTETVWNDGTDGGGTGGGLSQVFAKPQAEGLFYRFTGDKTKHPLMQRGVPDVAGNADPQSGWKIVVNRRLQPIGGTSAWAPAMAALYSIAIGLGYQPTDLKAAMYANPAVFHDILLGNNGNPSIAGELRGYAADHGWDACSGLGSPNGVEFLKLIGPPPAHV